MSKLNQTSISLPEEKLEIIKSLIEKLSEELSPYLKATSPEKRRDLPKMGDKSKSFVEKSLNHALENEEFAPHYLKIDEFESDYKAYKNLRSFYIPLHQLTRLIDDSMLLLGSDLYKSALCYYGSVKSGASNNIKSAKSIYKDLSDSYPRTPRRKRTPKESKSDN